MNRSTADISSLPTSLTRRAALGLGLAAGGTLALPAGGALAGGNASRGGDRTVRPQPGAVESADREVVLSRQVSVIVGKDTDAAAQRALTELLETNGCTVRTVTAQGADTTASGTRIHLGTPEDNPTLAAALETVGVEGPDGLAADGYVLAAAKDKGAVVALAGRDARGTFYAVQTLRQLLAGGTRLPAVQVRDEPLMEIRGAIEGFYGIPWSHQARLDHFAFYGAHKLNTYIYTPKDDLLLRSKWRELYAGDELENLAELVETANAHHVSFTFALSPGNDITYGSDDD
ncbi:MAG: beta-N-acetylglucosaminidase domain-containing protein, partial [Brachybacterium tyrofermentans]